MFRGYISTWYRKSVGLLAYLWEVLGTCEVFAMLLTVGLRLAKCTKHAMVLQFMTCHPISISIITTAPLDVCTMHQTLIGRSRFTVEEL